MLKLFMMYVIISAIAASSALYMDSNAHRPNLFGMIIIVLGLHYVATKTRFFQKIKNMLTNDFLEEFKSWWKKQ